MTLMCSNEFAERVQQPHWVRQTKANTTFVGCEGRSRFQLGPWLDDATLSCRFSAPSGAAVRQVADDQLYSQLPGVAVQAIEEMEGLCQLRGSLCPARG